MSFILSPEQLIVLSFISFGMVQAIEIVWVTLLKMPKPQVGSLQIICFVVSVVLAYFWGGGVIVPAFQGDVFSFALSLLTAASTVFVVAQVIYDKLMEPILRWLDTKVLKFELFRPTR